MSTTPQVEEILDSKQAAAFLKISLGYLRKLLAKNEIPGAQIGDHWRFRRSALIEWLKAREIQPATPPTVRGQIDA